MKALILHSLTLILLTLFVFSAACCSTRPDGTKTFGGLDTTQWGGVAVQTGSAYLDSKRQTTNAKGVVEVGPPAPEKTSWFDLGLKLIGL